MTYLGNRNNKPKFPVIPVVIFLLLWFVSAFVNDTSRYNDTTPQLTDEEVVSTTDTSDPYDADFIGCVVESVTKNSTTKDAVAQYESSRLIQTFEGFEATVKVCLGGNVTIGYGHTLFVDSVDEMLNVSVTRCDAYGLLQEDIRDQVRYLRHYLGSTAYDNLTEPQRIGLISFIYNVGPGNFRDSATRAIIKEANGKLDDNAMCQIAANLVAHHKYYDKKKKCYIDSDGLRIRRLVEAYVMFGDRLEISQLDLGPNTDKIKQRFRVERNRLSDK